jgi:hypothetical protein
MVAPGPLGQGGDDAMFSERIQKRYRLFWRKRRFTRHGPERCRDTLLRCDDPPEAWHCCRYWQRKLSNKWNSREFARRHGVAVPELYWHGRSLEELCFDALPDCYVIRPTTGHSARNVFAMAEGVNLLDGKPWSEDRLREALRALLAEPWNARLQLLVEEFVGADDGERKLPTEFKLHTFGDRVAAIGVVERGPDGARGGYYTADWTPLPEPLVPSRGAIPPQPPPDCLGSMLEAARTLGRAYGSYVRVDLYATPRGCVFGEFAPTPRLGRGFTAHAERYFEDLWRETMPDRI